MTTTEKTKVNSLFSRPSIKEGIMTVIAPPKATPVNASLVTKLVSENSLINMTGQQVVMFGAERQQVIGQKLDLLLAEITKGSSPVLFELFNQLKKGADNTNLGELEKQIRESLAKKWWHRIFDTIGISSPVKRIQKANGSIESMLTTKSKSLLDLTKGMEASIQKEVLELLQNTQKLSNLATEFRQNINDFAVYVDAGTAILAEGKIRAKEMTEAAEKSGDSLEIEAAKNFTQKVELFENRLVNLETIMNEAPVQLESIRLGQGASLSTLGETANSSMQDFNEIKTSLIKLSVSMQIKTVQALNSERRNLKTTLQNFGDSVLSDVAITAAKQSGLNRLEDAKNLLDSANKLKQISDEVMKESQNNTLRYEEARRSLTQVRALLK